MREKINCGYRFRTELISIDGIDSEVSRTTLIRKDYDERRLHRQVEFKVDIACRKCDLKAAVFGQGEGEYEGRSNTINNANKFLDKYCPLNSPQGPFKLK